MNFSQFDPWAASNDEKRELFLKYWDAMDQEDKEFDDSGKTQASVVPSQERVELEVAYEKLEAWGFIHDRRADVENPGNDLAGRTILVCIKKALKQNITVPAWLFEAFSKRLTAIVTNKAKRWSDKNAFGRERPKGAQIAKEKQVEEIGGLLEDLIMGYELPMERDSYAEIIERVERELGDKKLGIERLKPSGLEKIHQEYRRRYRKQPPWVDEILNGKEFFLSHFATEAD